jgi:hypothetical protein
MRSHGQKHTFIPPFHGWTIPARITRRKGTLANERGLRFLDAMTARRTLALFIALAAIASLVGQFYLNGAKPGLEPWGARAWDLARYFTILTNGLVAYAMLKEAAGRHVHPDLHLTAAINITMVCLIYQTLLAPEVPFQGLNWWTDFGFHLGVPVATLLWWLAFGPRAQPIRRLPYWLIWPVSYCLYAMTRGLMTGSYPYFFLDIPRFGAGQIALNIVGLVLVFALAGVVIWGMGRVARKLGR